MLPYSITHWVTLKINYIITSAYKILVLVECKTSVRPLMICMDLLQRRFETGYGDHLLTNYKINKLKSIYMAL